MGKVPPSTPFFKVNKQHIQEIGLEAALLLAYIGEYEAQNKECFASRPYIAKQLGISETTLHRLFQRLSKSGHITITRDGNKRFLHTSKLFKMNRQGVQNEQAKPFKLNFQGVQNEHIQRNTLQINSYKETHYKGTLVDNSKVSFEMVWDEAKQAMVRKRIAS
jgi:hypothetical protein